MRKEVGRHEWNMATSDMSDTEGHGEECDTAPSSEGMGHQRARSGEIRH